MKTDEADEVDETSEENDEINIIADVIDDFNHNFKSNIKDDKTFNVYFI